jgi:hypothetical protein
MLFSLATEEMLIMLNVNAQSIYDVGNTLRNVVSVFVGSAM